MFDPHDGKVYGTTSGQSQSLGTVFALNPVTTALTTLHSFSGGADGAFPVAGLILDSTGTLYGTTSAGANDFGTLFKLSTRSKAPQLITLYAFVLGSNGAEPTADLVFKDGALYGTTSVIEGGIFEFLLRPPKLIPLFDFTCCAGGPRAGLVFGAKGELYGTTTFGPRADFGTVFKLDLSTKTLTTLHAFSGGNDGATPLGDLIFIGEMLYGTTSKGGPNGLGTVFGVDPATARLTTLHSFRGTDGANPQAGLVYRSGALYGTTENGGAHGYGTVFKLEISTRKLTTFHHFAGGADGGYPKSRLVFDSTGALVGTTSGGGNLTDAAFGTVFKIGP